MSDNFTKSLKLLRNIGSSSKPISAGYNLIKSRSVGVLIVFRASYPGD
jgi:hypothetical protein